MELKEKVLNLKEDSATLTVGQLKTILGNLNNNAEVRIEDSHLVLVFDLENFDDISEPKDFFEVDGKQIPYLPVIENTSSRSVVFPKKVRCIEANIVFDSMTIAAKAAKCTLSSISEACKTGKKRKGYHWEYVKE